LASRIRLDPARIERGTQSRSRPDLAVNTWNA